MRLKRPSVHVACGVTPPSRRRVDGVDGSRPSVALIVQTGRAGDRPRSVRRDGEDVKTRRERRRRRRAAPRQARPQGQEARRPGPRLPAGAAAEPGAGRVPPAAALAPAAAAGRNRRRAKMLMVRKKTKSYANAQGIKAVSTKRPGRRPQARPLNPHLVARRPKNKN